MEGLQKAKGFLIPVVLLAGVIGYVAYRTRRVLTPRRRWRPFEQPAAQPLTPSDCQALQGMYTIDEGADFFGKTAVLKCSYTVENYGTVYHLSFFCQRNGTYIICEGKKVGNKILLQGHWRKAAANGTGLVRLIMESGRLTASSEQGENIQLWGSYGHRNRRPHKNIAFTFQRSLPDVPPFDILAHRGGSRNVDFLAVSENSLHMIKMAARLGANGVEIDVRMTKDNVPVVFHDSFFSIHTIQDKLYGGLLHNYTLDELRRLKLRKGGRIPTLEEMLSAALHQTPLEVVWLDIKKECDLEVIRSLQQKYMQEAAAIDRKLVIYLGIPDKYLLGCFKKFEDYQNIPSLTELDCQTAIEINADVWAPQYTGGFQRNEVAAIHAAGKKAYVWSLDSKLMIHAYITNGGFDGLVTNAAPVVAHWLYTTAATKKEVTS